MYVEGEWRTRERKDGWEEVEERGRVDGKRKGSKGQEHAFTRRVAAQLFRYDWASAKKTSDGLDLSRDKLG